MRLAPLLLAIGACAHVGHHPREQTRQGRWRLAQQPWTVVPNANAAGDADLAAGIECLVFVFDQAPLTVAKACDAGCRHTVHAAVSQAARHVGEPVIATVWIEGDRAHEIALDRTGIGVAVITVEGAAETATEGRYLLLAGAQARIRFTCAVSGAAGLAVRIVRELEVRE